MTIGRGCASSASCIPILSTLGKGKGGWGEMSEGKGTKIMGFPFSELKAGGWKVGEICSFRYDQPIHPLPTGLRQSLVGPPHLLQGSLG